MKDAKFNLYGNESSVTTTVEKADGNLYVSLLYRTDDIEIDIMQLGAKASSEALVLLENIVNQLKTKGATK